MPSRVFLLLHFVLKLCEFLNKIHRLYLSNHFSLSKNFISRGEGAKVVMVGRGDNAGGRMASACCAEGLQLLGDLLRYEPSRRPRADEAMPGMPSGFPRFLPHTFWPIRAHFFFWILRPLPDLFSGIILNAFLEYSSYELFSKFI